MMMTMAMMVVVVEEDGNGHDEDDGNDDDGDDGNTVMMMIMIMMREAMMMRCRNNDSGVDNRAQQSTNSTSTISWKSYISHFPLEGWRTSCPLEQSPAIGMLAYTVALSTSTSKAPPS